MHRAAVGLVLGVLAARAVRNRAGNWMIPPNGKPVAWTAERPETVPVVCDVHTWMKSWVVVKDHPYVTVTDEKGRFRLDDVPPGEYTLKVWHEKGGTAKEEVTVKVGAKRTVPAGFTPLTDPKSGP